MRVAVLASGEGTTLQALIDARRPPPRAFDVVLVISNNRDAGALRRARQAGIPVAHRSGMTHPDADALDRSILDELTIARVDLVVLSGYLKLVGPQVLNRYHRRIINTHPSLLPRHGGRGMHGRRVHEAVLAARDAVTGVSIHRVDAEYDSGEVIAQAQLPVGSDDTVETLTDRVQALERQFLCATLARIANGELT
jgi:phosphoribosylglycinamide formyltransferase-1